MSLCFVYELAFVAMFCLLGMFVGCFDVCDLTVIALGWVVICLFVCYCNIGYGECVVVVSLDYRLVFYFVCCWLLFMFVSFCDG